jgi:hypothetical protein
MPGIAFFYRSIGLDTDGKPLPTEPPAAPAVQTETPATQPEPQPRPGLATARMQIALLQHAIKKAMAQPLVEPEPQEDPTIRRHREVLTGEGEPPTPSELASAARWALQHRDQIED